MRYFKNQKGSVTLESTVSFTAFLFLFIILLSLMNFARAQSMMSNMVNEVAKEISQFSYIYSVTGLQEASNKLDDAAKEHQGEFGDLIETFNSITQGVSEAFSDSDIEKEVGTSFDQLEGSLKNIGDNVETLTEQLEAIVSNPQEMMMAVATILGSKASDELKSALAAALAKNMSHQYIDADKNQASLKLQRLGIENGLDDLNFKLSTMFHSGAPEDIIISVYYEVKMFSFFGLDLKANFIQTAHTRAWLSGDVTPQSNKSSGNPSDDSSENAEEEFTVWGVNQLNRGKEIIKLEMGREHSANSGLRRVYNKGIHAYDKEKNELIQYTSIDTYAKSYSEDKALEAQIKNKLNQFLRAGENLDSIKTHSMHAADDKQDVDLDKDKNYRMHLVFPDGTDEARINAILDNIKKNNSSNVKITYYIGYGKPKPIDPEEGG